MSLKLYKTEQELDLLMYKLEYDENGEIVTGQQEMLNLLKLEEHQKVINIGRFIKNLSAEIAAFKTEIENLKDKTAKMLGKKTWLENYLTSNVMGKTFEDSTVRVYWTKSSSVEVSDKELLFKDHKELFRHKESWELDKQAIRQAINILGEVPGAEIQQHTNLKIE